VQLPWLVDIELLRARCLDVLHCMIPILATLRGAGLAFSNPTVRLYGHEHLGLGQQRQDGSRKRLSDFHKSTAQRDGPVFWA